MKLWAAASQRLGLSSDEFWSLTLRQLFALFDAREAIELRADYRIARLEARYAEAHRDADHKPEPYRPLDFMPFAPTRLRTATTRDALRAWADATGAPSEGLLAALGEE